VSKKLICKVFEKAYCIVRNSSYTRVSTYPQLLQTKKTLEFFRSIFLSTYPLM